MLPIILRFQAFSDFYVLCSSDVRKLLCSSDVRKLLCSSDVRKLLCSSDVRKCVRKKSFEIHRHVSKCDVNAFESMNRPALSSQLALPVP